MRKAAFDSYAHKYDAHFTFSETGKLQRRRVHSLLAPYLSYPKKILEINCGTGEDAISFALAGHNVLATDISEEMITVSELKKEKLAASAFLQFKKCSFKHLKNITSEKHDLIFSNFGGLNCISPDEMKALPGIFSDILSGEGLLFFVVMGRKCKWEQFYFNRKGDRSKATRRLSKEGIHTVIEGEEMKTWYYSPDELSAFFGDEFITVEIKPVGLFLPPSYLNDYFSRKRPLLQTLNIAENLFGSVSVASNYADHYAIVLKKI